MSETKSMPYGRERGRNPPEIKVKAGGTGKRGDPIYRERRNRTSQPEIEDEAQYPGGDLKKKRSPVRKNRWTSGGGGEGGNMAKKKP